MVKGYPAIPAGRVWDVNIKVRGSRTFETQRVLTSHRFRIPTSPNSRSEIDFVDSFAVPAQDRNNGRWLLSQTL